MRDKIKTFYEGSESIRIFSSHSSNIYFGKMKSLSSNGSVTLPHQLMWVSVYTFCKPFIAVEFCNQRQAMITSLLSLIIILVCISTPTYLNLHSILPTIFYITIFLSTYNSMIYNNVCIKGIKCITQITHLINYNIIVSTNVISIIFRELQYLRHKIHLGLFLAYGLSAFSWIVTILMTGKLYN